MMVGTILVTSVFSAQAQSNPVLVSTEWLAEHGTDVNLLILYVGMSHSAMPDRLIRGARFLDYHAFADDRNGLTTEIQPVAQMEEALRAAGVSI